MRLTELIDELTGLLKERGDAEVAVVGPKYGYHYPEIYPGDDGYIVIDYGKGIPDEPPEVELTPEDWLEMEADMNRQDCYED